MKNKQRFSRRVMLRGALMGAAIGLPVPLLDVTLNGHGTALANGQGLPRRFGVWWYGNGVRLARWVPASTGKAYALSSELESMVDVKDDITIVSGTRCPVTKIAHHSGQGGMLTGDTVDRYGDDSSKFRRKSVDVLVSDAWAGQTPFGLLNVGVHRDPRFERGTPGHVSFNGTSFNPNEMDPGALYDRLFGGGVPVVPSPAETESAEARARARSRVLDAVLDDLGDLQSAVGRADRARLEQHADGLRDLQRRILEFDRSMPASSCSRPLRPDFSAMPNDETRIAQKHRLMSELVAKAFACDLTRVATLMHHTWYAPAFREAGVASQQHGLTHNEGGDQPQVHSSVVFVMSNLATFFRTLKGIPEGAGTLLDNCAIYATTEVSEGRTHSQDDMPIVLGGGAGGSLLRGHHVRLPGVSSFRVIMSLFSALKLDIPSFGAGEWAETNPLSELLV